MEYQNYNELLRVIGLSYVSHLDDVYVDKNVGKVNAK